MRTDTAAWGRWVESAVGAHLLNHTKELGYDIYYWRKRYKEVDFVVKRDGLLTAIEVKSGRRGMNSGLPTFKQLFHPERSLVVGTGRISLEDFFCADLEKVIV